MGKSIADLHFITQDISGFSHAEQAELVCSAGVKWVQLRMKDAEEKEFKETAWVVKKICKNHGAVLIINDNVSVAQKIQADGVHLGKKDMLPSKARLLLGPAAIIGGTANTLRDMLWCTEEGCDYIGVGPYRFTNTKKELSPIVGSCGMINLIEAYLIQAANPVPIIAIGGIEVEDISELLLSGYHGVAVSTAIAKAPNPSRSAQKFLDQFPSPGGARGGSLTPPGGARGGSHTPPEGARGGPYPSPEGPGVGKKPERRKIIPYNAKLKERARKLRNNSTLSEILLWKKLKGKQMKGFDFDRQRPINNYIVDFYCKDLMLALEVDGSSHDNKFIYDVRRQQKLESLGVKFLRFTDLEVKKDMNTVLSTIENWIKETELVPYDHQGSAPNPSQVGA